MTRAPLPLGQLFDAHPAIARWNERRRREEAVARLVRRCLPRPLAERVRVADAQGSELLLATDAGAVAALVRQRIPDIVRAMRDNGCEFTGIRVRVQVRSVPAAPRKIDINQPDRESLRGLAELARELPAGPLKAALARFLRRVGG